MDVCRGLLVVTLSSAGIFFCALGDGKWVAAREVWGQTATRRLCLFHARLCSPLPSSSDAHLPLQQARLSVAWLWNDTELLSLSCPQRHRSSRPCTTSLKPPPSLPAPSSATPHTQWPPPASTSISQALSSCGLSLPHLPPPLTSLPVPAMSLLCSPRRRPHPHTCHYQRLAASSGPSPRTGDKSNAAWKRTEDLPFRQARRRRAENTTRRKRMLGVGVECCHCRRCSKNWSRPGTVSSAHA
jgi:hypothetical protein